MRTLIVYESMYGNTRAVAESIADGIRRTADVKVVPVAQAQPDMLNWAELVIVGGPTHAHGMTRAATRQSAAEVVAKPGNQLSLEPGAVDFGLREWLAATPAAAGKRAAAFDTRLKAPAFLTGRASGGIANELERHDFVLIAEPESFLVDTSTRLIAGELERAREWGTRLVGGLVPIG